jgi:hypothetical protein
MGHHGVLHSTRPAMRPRMQWAYCSSTAHLDPVIPKTHARVEEDCEISGGLGEMATMLPLAMLAASAAPGTCISGAPGPAPFLGICAHLSLRLPGSLRGVACALRRRPTKYKQVISQRTRRCLISSSRFRVIGALRHAWMSHETSLET